MFNELQTVYALKAATHAGEAQLILADLQFSFIAAGLTVIGFLIIIGILTFIYHKLVEKFGTEDDDYKYRRF